MPSRACPESLVSAWRQIAMRTTGDIDEKCAVRKLEAAAKLLSDTFTTGREPGFADYQQNREALVAYGLFFFPRTYVRTRMVLEECAADWAFREDTIRITDLGAGTGAAGLAALETLSTWLPGTHLNLELVDRATDGFTYARQLFTAGHALWPTARLTETQADAQSYKGTHNPSAPPRDGKGTDNIAPGPGHTLYVPTSSGTLSVPQASRSRDRGTDIILASFSVNEWMEGQTDEVLQDWVGRQIKALAPGGWLVIMEPALRASVERMERLRDWVAAEKIARILAPCPHHLPCQILAQKRGWCHEVRRWQPPSTLRLLNRQLQRDIELLKWSFLVLQNVYVPNSPYVPDSPGDWTRLVSPVRKEKGKYTCHGCGADGLVRRLEWLTRNLTENQKQASETLERGDRVSTPQGTPLSDNTTMRIDSPPMQHARTLDTSPPPPQPSGPS